MSEQIRANRKAFLKAHFEEKDHCRLSDNIPKHQKMSTSPFVFFRGSAPLFYHDINIQNKHESLSLPAELSSIPLTTIVGDCHVSNFGFLTEEGSHGDDVVFTANDFDDACIGHASWDIARFITSLYLSALHCQGVVKGDIESDKSYQGKMVVSDDDALKAANAFVQQYLVKLEQSINDPKTRDNILDQYTRPHILAKRFKKAQQRASTGEDFYSKSTIAKAVDTNDTLKFKHLPDTFRALATDEYNSVASVFRSYVDDTILDIVERLNAGTGSVNMKRYYLLVGPKDASKHQLPLTHIVEVKQQRPGAPLSIAEPLSPINLLNPAHLTVYCQRRMQRRPDLVLDEVLWQNKHWLVRSRHHTKVGIKPEHIGLGGKSTTNGGFIEYAISCADALALAHCRGDRRSTLFEQACVPLLQKHQNGLIESCQKYAKQVVTDCELLKEWLAEG